MKITVFFLFFIQVIVAQPGVQDHAGQLQYRFSHIGVPDGLAPGAVNCFYKDSRDFIWIGTISGLNRYDGYTIETFDPDPLDTLAIHSKNYKDIYEDPLGNIWVNTLLETFIFNPETEEFSIDQSAVLKKLQVSGKPIRRIQKDSSGNFWFIHKNGGITKYITEEHKTIDIELSIPGEAYSEEITSFKENSKGDFWIVYANGLLSKLDGKTLKIVFSSYKLQENLPQTDYDYKMVIDGNDDLWLHLFEDFGIFQYDVKKNILTNFTNETAPITLSSNLVSGIEKDAKGMIWVATDHGGINVINPKDRSVHYILNNPETSNSLSHNSITGLYKDRDGIMWVGTFKNGVDYYHPNIVRFPLFKNLVSDTKSLPYNDVNVFAEDGQGNIYIGTNGGGLLFLNRKTGVYKQYIHNTENPNSISSNVVVSLLYDSKGDLWVGTYRGGLNKMTKGGFKTYRHNNADSTSIAGDNIWELFEDSQNNLWVGTLSGGLDVLDRKKEVFYHGKIGDVNYTLHDTYVAAIAEDRRGNLWAGGNNGIDVFNPKTHEHAYYAHEAKDTTSLSSNYILSIYPDSTGNVWVGTQEGLNLFDEKSASFYRYSVKDGLPGKKIIAIVEDDQNDLWLTSSFGITQFQKDKTDQIDGRIPPNFKNYNDLDGLQGNLFNENAIFKTKTGELLVGGMHGFNRFNPRKFEYNKKKPKIIFTEFSLFNKPVEVHEEINGRVLLKKPIQVTDKITLNYSENLFTVAFAALDFFQPSKNKYSYKLEGFDNAWQSASSKERRVTYTNLDPGEYQFKVRASNNDQVWTQDPATLTIKILPPFYKTIYAYVFYSLAILALLYFARTRIIMRQRRNFKVEQDKREAEHVHEMDVMKIRFFTNISHEFKTPLSLILAPLEKLKAYEINVQAKEQLDTINKNAYKLLRLINQVLDLGNVKKETLLSSSQDNIIAFIKEIVHSFQKLAENKGLTINFKTAIAVFNTSFDTDKLDKILYNLIANAIKFTPKGGAISVELKLKNTSELPSHKKILEIKVRDTGIGIGEKEKEKIFDRFFKVEHPEAAQNSGSGIGLSLVKEYIDLYKGKISVKSALGSGSVFTIKIPLKDLGDSITSFPVKEEVALKTTNNELKSVEKQGVFNILIIDDDEDFLNYLAKSLLEFFNVFIAQDGEAGWKKALAVRPDLIICDSAMPVMSGTALCRKIRGDSRTRHIPFIMLTANAQEENKLLALKIGVSDYITKPFSFEVLYTRIQNLIKQRKSFQQAYSKKLKMPKVSSKAPLESEDEKLMRRVLEIIKKQYSNPDFSVKKLALELGVSRTFLYNKTVVLFEKPPLELITDIRLAHGKALLADSQLTISEIAFQVGFNNPKYFTKNFKKKFGILPSKFKETTD